MGIPDPSAAVDTTTRGGIITQGDWQTKKTITST